MRVTELITALQAMDPDAELTVDIGAVRKPGPTPAEVWDGLSEDERHAIGHRVEGDDCEDLVRLGVMTKHLSGDGTATYYHLTDLGTAVRAHGNQLKVDAFIAKIEVLRSAAADLCDSWGGNDWSDGYPFGYDMYEVVEHIDGWIRVQREATQ